MKAMSSRRRILAAVRGEPGDAIPISPRLGFAVSHHCGSHSAAAHLRLKKTYDYDPLIDMSGNRYPFTNPYEIYSYAPGVHVKLDVRDEGTVRVVNRHITTPDGVLTEVFKVVNPGRKEYGANPNPIRLEHMVKGPEDLAKLRHLLPPVDASLAHEVLNWEHVVGEEGLVRCVMYGPVDHQAGETIAIEELLMGALADRPFVEKLVGMFEEQILAQTKAMLEMGVRVFFTPYYWHSLSVGWSPRIFRDWFLPFIKRSVDLIHSYGGHVFYYDDGKCMGIVPFLVEAKVDVLETCTPAPVGDFDLAEAKKRWGDRISFKGYTDLIYVLQKGTVEDVRRTVRFACEVGGKGGRFLLGTSDSMREGTPIANIDEYFRAGREFGKA